MNDYALLAAASLPRDLAPLTQAIATVCGERLIDVAGRLHRGRGLLAEHLALGPAQDLGRQLAALGLPTCCLPQAALLPLERPGPVTRAAVEPAALAVEDHRQRVRRWPWGNLQLLAGALLEKDERGPAELLAGPAAAGPASLRLVAEGDDEGPPRQVLLDLVFAPPTPGYCRIDSVAFNYAYLAAGGRAGLRREEKLQALAADLVAAAGAAWVTSFVRALAAGVLELRGRIEDSRLLDAETRWRRQRLQVVGVPTA
ncbi:MAG: hypothetical protein IT204_19790 [Fimbriimonadaceae bacterium]|nr:hypothetical protein [Fimbriimonadaceae bacterium]